MGLCGHEARIWCACAGLGVMSFCRASGVFAWDFGAGSQVLGFCRIVGFVWRCAEMLLGM